MQVLLADMLMHIVSSAANTLLNAVQMGCKKVSEKQVMDSIDSVLPSSFAQALEVTEDVPCAESEILTSKVSKEVVKVMSFTLLYKEVPLISPKRLTTMDSSTGAMIQKLASKMNKMWQPKAGRKREKTQSQQGKADTDKSLRSAAAVKMERQFSADNGAHTKLMVQKRIADFMEPFLASSDPEFDQRHWSSLLMDAMVENIIQLVTEGESEEKQATSSRPGNTKKAVDQRVKDFFRTCVCIDAVHRLIQLCTSSCLCSNDSEPVSSRQLIEDMKSLDAELTELFTTKDGQTQEDDGQTDFNKDKLSEILHQHIRNTMNTPDTTPVQTSTSSLMDEQQPVGVVTFHFSEQIPVAPDPPASLGTGQPKAMNSIHS
ncbi:unnamed protein product, partial [Lampetra planeri]